jgi:glycosyltransferase involved in cell wall biosynthesis
MEALSFSVPVVAADSGGIRELVGGRKGCGQLLPHDPSPREIASAIDHFMTMDKGRLSLERKKAYETWERNVNADRNFFDFTEELKGMAKDHPGDGAGTRALQ